jgi:CheY-like chemotaxis protein
MDGREVLVLIESDESLKLIPTVILTTSAARADFVECYHQLRRTVTSRSPVELGVFEDLVKNLSMTSGQPMPAWPQLVFVA